MILREFSIDQPLGSSERLLDYLESYLICCGWSANKSLDHNQI